MFIKGERDYRESRKRERQTKEKLERGEIREKLERGEIREKLER